MLNLQLLFDQLLGALCEPVSSFLSKKLLIYLFNIVWYINIHIIWQCYIYTWYICTLYGVHTGLSLKTQELTAIFLILRISTYFGLFQDVHVVLDSLILGATIWVIYMIRFKLKSTYTKELDNMPLFYVVSKYLCLLLHPHSLHSCFMF